MLVFASLVDTHRDSFLVVQTVFGRAYEFKVDFWLHLEVQAEHPDASVTHATPLEALEWTSEIYSDVSQIPEARHHRRMTIIQ